MKIWNSAPLIRLLIPFLTGIITAIFFPYVNSKILPFIFLLLITVGILMFIPLLSRSYQFLWLYGALFNVFFLLSGYQLTVLKTDRLLTTHYSHYLDQSPFIYARVAAAGVEKEKSVKIVLECLRMDNQGKQLQVSGKVLVYFQKDDKALKLNYGDELILKNKLKELTPPQNPDEFNYKRFLSYKNIYHQAYVRSTEWIGCSRNSGNLLQSFSLKLRSKLLLIFQQAQVKGNEFAVASALLLGYTDKLDDNLLAAYSETGTLHVLSVSGLHVAIIFVIFNTILFFLDSWRYGRFLKVLLLFSFLWFYALLSGLSPSVLRSATMFSFIVFARSFKRTTTIYNTLAASAFLLLLTNPYLIMDVGFQLSYLAVTGIVYFQPFFSGWITSERWLFRQLADLISVSIAAQLATFPVSLYYFHQFPNYFLISNLLVIPLSTCIMYLGLLLLASSPCEWLVNNLALVFSKMLTLLNGLVAVISKWPYALSDFIFVGFPQLLLMYALLFITFYFISNKKIYFLKLGLCIGIVLLLLQINRQWQNQHQRKIVMYAISGHTVMDFISGPEHTLLMDSVSKNEKAWMAQLKPYWGRLGLKEPAVTIVPATANYLYAKHEFIQFYQYRLLHVDDRRKIQSWFRQKKKCKVDYVILSGNAGIELSELITVCSPSCIVFDKSNSHQTVEKWKTACNRLQQSFYAMEDSGAFILE